MNKTVNRVTCEYCQNTIEQRGKQVHYWCEAKKRWIPRHQYKTGRRCAYYKEIEL